MRKSKKEAGKKGLRKQTRNKRHEMKCKTNQLKLKVVYYG
jgi:hypothetical protein